MVIRVIQARSYRVSNAIVAFISEGSFFSTLTLISFKIASMDFPKRRPSITGEAFTPNIPEKTPLRLKICSFSILVNLFFLAERSQGSLMISRDRMRNFRSIFAGIKERQATRQKERASRRKP